MSTSKWIEQSANDCIHTNHHKIHKQKESAQTQTNRIKWKVRVQTCTGMGRFLVDRAYAMCIAWTCTTVSARIHYNHTYSTHLLQQQTDCSLLPPINNNNIQWCPLLAIIQIRLWWWCCEWFMWTTLYSQYQITCCCCCCCCWCARRRWVIVLNCTGM